MYVNILLLLFISTVAGEYNKLSLYFSSGYLYINHSTPLENVTECSNETFRYSIIDSIPLLTVLWPGIDYQQQWGIYGICNGLSPFVYYNRSINSALKLESPVIKYYYDNNLTLDFHNLANLYGGLAYADISCENDTFTTIDTCWTVDLLTQIACPFPAMTTNCPNTVYLTNAVQKKNNTIKPTTIKSIGTIYQYNVVNVLVLIIASFWLGNMNLM
jgi:hypothetical protein